MKREMQTEVPMVDSGMVPLAEAVRMLGGLLSYPRGWRGCALGAIPSVRRHGRLWVRVGDVAAYGPRKAGRTRTAQAGVPS